MSGIDAAAFPLRAMADITNQSQPSFFKEPDVASKSFSTGPPAARTNRTTLTCKIRSTRLVSQRRPCVEEQLPLQHIGS